MMEYWQIECRNAGKTGNLVPYPSFHHSIIPLLHRWGG
jgi:hypothetical protein